MLYTINIFLYSYKSRGSSPGDPSTKVPKQSNPLIPGLKYRQIPRHARVCPRGFPPPPRMAADKCITAAFTKPLFSQLPLRTLYFYRFRSDKLRLVTGTFFASQGCPLTRASTAILSTVLWVASHKWRHACWDLLLKSLLKLIAVNSIPNWWA